MSTLSASAVIRFGSADADSSDPDSPCAEAELDDGSGSISGGLLGSLDRSGLYQGYTPTEPKLDVSISTSLNAKSASSSGRSALSATLSIDFSPYKCSDWIDQVCWTASPSLWPEIRMTDFEHEGEGYEMDGDIPVVRATISGDDATLDEDVRLSVSWPRGDLRGYIEPSGYTQLITWEPFSLDDPPEAWVAGPHFPGDVKSDDSPFATTLRYAYRVPVRFVLVCEGYDYDLGSTADFASIETAFKPVSKDGGLVILHDGETLNPAFRVTSGALSSALGDGWDGSSGIVEMLCYRSWGHCEFTLHSRCPKDDYQPGDDDVSVVTPYGTWVTTPETAGTEVLDNPRVSRFVRSQAVFDSTPVSRVRVAKIEPHIRLVIYFFNDNATYGGMHTVSLNGEIIGDTTLANNQDAHQMIYFAPEGFEFDVKTEFDGQPYFLNGENRYDKNLLSDEYTIKLVSNKESTRYVCLCAMMLGNVIVSTSLRDVISERDYNFTLSVKE